MISGSISQNVVDDIVQFMASQLERDEEREDWLRLASQNLARAYSDNEPDYSHVVATKTNPQFAM
ncbi:MAG: hypothetical protein MUF71_14475 [Candidatus Kapabacteria bacterium]|nr:hypothetical protein [Candidatus Kapabacteria bacterium]